MAVIDGVAAAYSTAAQAGWQDGPARVYDRLADVVLGRSPVALSGLAVLDVGAGTGAATRAALAAGAGRVIAVDAAIGMLASGRPGRPPAVAADAIALPFADASFDGAVAAFSLNHLAEPAAGLREMARVTRRRGPLLVAAYADDDAHPVKRAVEAALADRGWVPEPWYAAVRSEAIPRLATPDACAAVAGEAGLDATVEAIGVPFPELGAPELVAWRLGLAQHAPFLARLPQTERAAVAADAAALLGKAVAPLVRSILVIAAVRP